MPEPIEFSARSEVAAVIQRVATRHPEFLEDVLKTLEETYPNINSSSRKPEDKNARLWYRRFYAAQRQRDIDARVAGTSEEVPLPSKPLRKTDLLIQASNEKVGSPPMGDAELPASVTKKMTADWAKEKPADAARRKINHDKRELGTALGHHLEKISAEHFEAFKAAEDPMAVIDFDPVLIHPRELHPEGKGPDFDRGPLLVIQSFTAKTQGHVFVRDYTLNNSPTTKEHPCLVEELDANKKIRSTKKDGDEFYAWAFWVQEGDQLRGCLSVDGRDLAACMKYFRVQNGTLKRISKDEWKKWESPEKVREASSVTGASSVTL